MRIEYRIKVKEHMDGSIAYIPQVSHIRIHIGKLSCRPWIEWENLILHSSDYVYNSFHEEQSWFAEEAARLIIDRYKKQLEDEDKKKVKNIRFINL
jgi:hypothetical protein